MSIHWDLRFSKRAQKDAKKVAKAGLKKIVDQVLDEIEADPYSLPHEKLRGDFNGLYSRRINIQHRLVYQILKRERIVVILAMWTHYE